jgi:hypothetical protein
LRAEVATACRTQAKEKLCDIADWPRRGRFELGWEAARTVRRFPQKLGACTGEPTFGFAILTILPRDAAVADVVGAGAREDRAGRRRGQGKRSETLRPPQHRGTMSAIAVSPAARGLCPHAHIAAVSAELRRVSPSARFTNSAPKWRRRYRRNNRQDAVRQGSGAYDSSARRGPEEMTGRFPRPWRMVEHALLSLNRYAWARTGELNIGIVPIRWLRSLPAPWSV